MRVTIDPQSADIAMGVDRGLGGDAFDRFGAEAPRYPGLDLPASALLDTLLLPLSVVVVGYYLWIGDGRGFGADVEISWLLAAAGVVTAVPLILYANGAKLLRLSTIGIMQYIAPTMIFITAIFIFKEPFSHA